MTSKVADGINNHSLPHNQGQSKFTFDKQYGLRKVLKQWLSIVNRIKHKAARGDYDKRPSLKAAALRDVLYADINAGSGWNSSVNCIGSPILFLEEAKQYDFKQDVYFIEEDVGSVVSLGERLREAGEFGEGFNLLNGNHNKVLPPIIKASEPRYGLIYHDPNGLPSFDLFKEISRYPNFYFMDILIRISGTNYKRIRNGAKAVSQTIRYPNLKDQLLSIKKREWIIREICDPDPYQWTFLLGSNWPEYPDWKQQGFYKISESKGAAILNRVAYTVPELEDYGNDKI